MGTEQRPRVSWGLDKEAQGQRPVFALDEEEDAPLLVAQPPAGAAAAAAANGVGAGSPAQASFAKGRLLRTVSRFTLATGWDDESTWEHYRHEAARITELALPLTISQFFAFALGLIALLFVGRLGEEQLAVAVLATSFMNVTGFSLVLGLLGALDTLCGQAWGAKNYRALGLNLQKALLTTLATSLVIAFGLWAHVEGLLLAAGQQEAIAAGAARFMLLATPALLCAGAFECLKRYLMAQGVVRPVTAVSCTAVLLAVPFNWLLIFHLQMGLDGAALAMVATWCSMLALLLLFVVWHERSRRGTSEQTWHGWSLDCLQGLGTYYRLAIPSTLMVCLEWWAYELTIFMAGWLPSPTLHVAAQGVMLQVSGFAYMLPMGLSCATSVRVSNALGANLPHAARRSAYTATAMTVGTQATLATALVLGRNVWGAVFTDQQEVVAACAAAFPIMALSMMGDGLNATIGGMLRGAGRQVLGAWLMLGSFWGVGLPIAYLLAVHAGLNLKGLWFGLVASTTLQGCISLLVLLRTDWKQQAARAADLVTAGSSDSAGCGGGVGCEDSAAGLHLRGGSGSGEAEELELSSRV